MLGHAVWWDHRTEAEDLSMRWQVPHMKYTRGIPRAGAGHGSELDAGQSPCRSGECGR